MIYKLTHSIKEVNDKQQNVEISEINITRMKTKHLRLLPAKIFEIKSGRKKDSIDPILLLPLVAALTGLTEDQLGEVDMVDLPQIIDKVMSIVGEALDQAV